MAPIPKDLDDLLSRALLLPEEARAALAGKLLDSLDSSVDEGAEDEWSRESASRLSDLDRGAVKPVPWSEARQAILRPGDEPKHS